MTQAMGMLMTLDQILCRFRAFPIYIVPHLQVLNARALLGHNDFGHSRYT
jgi:hypothetical protein